jgi:hypothetical protein
VKELYKKYRDLEPDPARETPGFRVPKKYQIEFLFGELKNEASDTAKFYDQWVKVEDAVPAVLYRSIADCLSPPRMFWESAAKYQFDRGLHARQEPFVLVPAGTKPEEGVYYRAPLPALGEAWPSPATVEKQLIGRLAVAAGLGPLALHSPLSLAYVAELSKNRIEKLPRVQALGVEVASLIANASRGVAGLLTFPPHLAEVVKFRSFSEVQSGIVDELQQKRRSDLMQADLLQFKSKLDDYARSDEFKKKQQDWRAAKSRAERSNQPAPAFEPPPMPAGEYWQAFRKWKIAKAEAESHKTEPPKFQPPPAGEKEDQKPIPIKDYIDRYAKPRGLVLAGMKEPRSKIELFKETGDTPMGTLLKPIFMRAFGDQYTDQVAFQSLTSQKGWYEAAEINAPREDPREFALYWRSFETDARTPPLADCEPLVRDAWKLAKARAKAEEAAQAIANDKEIKGNPDGYRKLIDHKDFQDYRQVKLHRYELTDPFRLSGMVNYKLAKPPAFIEYPPDDLIDRALESLQNPGDTLVVANKPRSNYYVLFLVKRDQPRASEEIWVRQFDQEVIYPDAAKQMQVDNMSITRWVAQQETQQFNKDWEQYVKAATKFDSEKAVRLKSFLDNLMRGQGSSEEF